MFAKIFSQIYDSSIVEHPETRFTFMDLLILADPNGVVDMTHEAISRRTNRAIEVVRATITELEGPDPRSRSPFGRGARIVRLDDHRDWGWIIVNYGYFRRIASEEQRREKTRERVKKFRQLNNVTLGNDSPSASSSTSSLFGECENLSTKSKCTQKEAEAYCVSIGLLASDGEAMFLKFEESGWAKVKSWKSTIRRWQICGYHPSQKNGQKPKQKLRDVTFDK